MPQLLRLPDELLVQIAQALPPEDVVNFALSCQRIKNASSKRLREHRELQRKYCNVYLFTDDEQLRRAILAATESSGSHPFTAKTYPAHIYNHPIILVSEILENPTVGRYVRKVFFRPEDPFWGGDGIHPSSNSGPGVSETISKISSTHYPELDFLKSWEIDMQHWLDRVQRGQHGPCFALLLTLLPNVTKLILECFREYEAFIKDAIDIIRQKRAWEKAPSEAFNSLHTVRVVDRIDPLPGREKVESLDTFGALPSLRWFEMNRVLIERTPCSPDEASSSDNTNFNYVPGTIWPERRGFRKCSRARIAKVKFPSLLQLVKGLRTLQIHSDNTRNIDTITLPTLCTELLYGNGWRGSKDTLQHLCLNFSRTIGFQHPVCERLKSFSNLKTLEISNAIICKDVVDFDPKRPADRSNRAHRALVTTDIASLELELAQRNLRVVDFLPPRLEEFRWLGCHIEYELVEAMFDGFLELQPERLPLLQQIALCGPVNASPDVPPEETKKIDHAYSALSRLARRLDRQSNVTVVALRDVTMQVPEPEPFL